MQRLNLKKHFKAKRVVPGAVVAKTGLNKPINQPSGNTLFQNCVNFCSGFFGKPPWSTTTVHVAKPTDGSDGAAASSTTASGTSSSTKGASYKNRVSTQPIIDGASTSINLMTMSQDDICLFIRFSSLEQIVGLPESQQYVLLQVCADLISKQRIEGGLSTVEASFLAALPPAYLISIGTNPLFVEKTNNFHYPAGSVLECQLNLKIADKVALQPTQVINMDAKQAHVLQNINDTSENLVSTSFNFQLIVIDNRIGYLDNPKSLPETVLEIGTFFWDRLFKEVYTHNIICESVRIKGIYPKLDSFSGTTAFLNSHGGVDNPGYTESNRNLMFSLYSSTVNGSRNSFTIRCPYAASTLNFSKHADMRVLNAANNIARILSNNLEFQNGALVLRLAVKTTSKKAFTPYHIANYVATSGFTANQKSARIKSRVVETAVSDGQVNTPTAGINSSTSIETNPLNQGGLKPVGLDRYVLPPDSFLESNTLYEGDIEPETQGESNRP